MFSSISEEDRVIVIKKCYWPLLNLIKRGYPIAIQPSGITLEIIQKLDPDWIEELKKLLKEKKCELIGEGYSHIIAPLAPAEVNDFNLSFGRKIYKNILGISPKIATVSEMAYSAGLVKIFKKNGYKSVLMDWNNSAQYHPEWKKEWKYHPQIVLGAKEEKIPVIWGNFVSFQKFQRYVNGVIELDEYLDYIRTHKTNGAERFLLCYGSDSEIFDFRTRRFASRVEGKASRGEWERIAKLFEALSAEKDVRLIFPSQVLNMEKDKKNAFNKIRLESPEDPIPVKKQEKYNITRWGLTGHSVAINTACYKIYENIKNIADPSLWKELCYLWSSDFRTHIEQNRFLDFEKRLEKIFKISSYKKAKLKPKNIPFAKNVKITQTRRHLEVDTKDMNVVFNIHKGLTINSATFKKISHKPIFGGIFHDYYDDVRLEVDFFSGHSVIGVPGKSQMTDLGAIKPKVENKGGVISVSARSALGSASRNQAGGGWIKKIVSIIPAENKIEIDYSFDFISPDFVSWRTGFVTLLPETFKKDSLYFSCKNGGADNEKFLLRGVKSIDKKPVSLMVSAPSSLGNTGGELEIGDNEKKIFIKTDMAKCAALPMIQFENLPKTFLLRSFFSLGEIDDTTSHAMHKQNHKARFTMSISAQKS